MAKKDNSTEATEELSLYESIIFTCCCTSSSSDENENSFVKEDKNRQQQHHRRRRRRRKKKGVKYLDRLSDFALYLVGLAPPVKFVQCYDCVSVDDSELTLPAALSEMADEYDQITSILSVIEDIEGKLAKSDDFMHSLDRNGGKRSGRIKFKNSSDSTSVFTEGPICLQGA